MKYVLYQYDTKFKKLSHVVDIVDTLDEAKQESYKSMMSGSVLYYLPEDKFSELKNSAEYMERYIEYKKEEARGKNG